MPIVKYVPKINNFNIDEYKSSGAKFNPYQEAYRQKGNEDLVRVLGTSTSDHAYRVTQVNETAPAGFKLTVATFNMLERAKLTKDTGNKMTSKSNNPLCTKEDANQYLARKKAQMLTLVQILIGPPRADFLCLQEADWAFDMPDDSKVKGLTNAKEEIRNEMMEIFEALGYGMIIPKVSPGEKQQHLVTLFDKNAFEHHDSGEVNLLDLKMGQYRAHGCIFTLKGLSVTRSFAIVNAHLEYTDNFKANDRLLAENYKVFADDTLAVFTGDFNHNLSQTLPYSMGTKEPTVVSAVKDRGRTENYVIDKTTNAPQLTLDDDETKRPACYDATIVLTATGHPATAQVVGGQYIDMNPDKKSVTFRNLSESSKHQNKPRKIRNINAGTVSENEKIELEKLESELSRISNSIPRMNPNDMDDDEELQIPFKPEILPLNFKSRVVEILNKMDKLIEACRIREVRNVGENRNEFASVFMKKLTYYRTFKAELEKQNPKQTQKQNANNNNNKLNAQQLQQLQQSVINETLKYQQKQQVDQNVVGSEGRGKLIAKLLKEEEEKKKQAELEKQFQGLLKANQLKQQQEKQRLQQEELRLQQEQLLQNLTVNNNNYNNNNANNNNANINNNNNNNNTDVALQQQQQELHRQQKEQQDQFLRQQEQQRQQELLRQQELQRQQRLLEEQQERERIEREKQQLLIKETYGVVNEYMDLKTCPNPKNFGKLGAWQTIGDLHGNALKLLNFLIMRGAVKFKGEDQEGLYQAFRKLYDIPANSWKKDPHIKLFNELLAKIDVSKHAKIRLIGDDLADRGMNDYLTLRLINHIITNGAQAEIILSNHTAQFVRQHEVTADKKNYRNVDLNEDDSRSAHGLQDFIDNGTIDQNQVNALYGRYSEHVRILAYDLGADDELQIHSHAPINEVDILRMALCLIDDKPGSQDFINRHVNDEQRDCIRRALSHALGKPYNEEKGPQCLNNQDLMNLISIINQVASSCAHARELTKLTELQITNTSYGLDYGWAYGPTGKNDIDEDAKLFPFKFAYWNRENPKKNMMGTNIKSACKFTNNYGHIGPRELGYGVKADALVGRPGYLDGDLPVIVSKPYPKDHKDLPLHVTKPFKARGAATNVADQDKQDWLLLFSADTQGDAYFDDLKKKNGTPQRDAVTEALADSREIFSSPSAFFDDKIKSLDLLHDAIANCGGDNQQSLLDLIAAKHLELLKQNVKLLEAEHRNRFKSIVGRALGLTATDKLGDTIVDVALKDDASPLYRSIMDYAKSISEHGEGKSDSEVKSHQDAENTFVTALLSEVALKSEAANIKAAVAKKKKIIPPVTTSTLPAAGAQVVNGQGPAAKKAAAATQARRVLRNNIDALQTFFEVNEKTPIELTGLIKKLQAAKPDQRLMIDKDNYVIVNTEMQNAPTAVKSADEFKNIIHTQITAYVTDKTLSMKAEGRTDSRLLEGYQNMRKTSPDADALKKFKDEMHGRAQVKKWSLVDNLPAEITGGLNADKQFVGFTQAHPGKHFIKDLVKVYENSSTPVFESNEDLVNILNKYDVKMNIDGRDYYIRGKIKNGVAVFVKCQNKTEEPYFGMSISDANIDAFKKANNVDSFSVAVMVNLGNELKKDPTYKNVEFKEPEKPAPKPAPKPT